MMPSHLLECVDVTERTLYREVEYFLSKHPFCHIEISHMSDRTNSSSDDDDYRIYCYDESYNQPAWPKI